MSSSYHLTNADGTAEELDDHGDGTGTFTTYDENGRITTTEPRTCLDPDPEEPDPVLELLDAAKTKIQKMTSTTNRDAMLAILEAVRVLAGP